MSLLDVSVLNENQTKINRKLKAAKMNGLLLNRIQLDILTFLLTLLQVGSELLSFTNAVLQPKIPNRNHRYAIQTKLTNARNCMN